MTHRQFLVRNNHVACPVCDTELTVSSEQDKRVAIFKHEGVTNACPRYGKYFRIDRFTGYGEDYAPEKPPEIPLQPFSKPTAWKKREGESGNPDKAS